MNHERKVTIRLTHQQFEKLRQLAHERSVPPAVLARERLAAFIKSQPLASEKQAQDV